MIVKFHARGRGGGSGPVDYLLGKERNREGATLLRGDAEETKALIDSNDYAQRYTSGVLSFEEKDISDDAKQQIMDSFEDALLPGLDGDQYNVMWVEHQDKGRLELNFLVPNVELTTGKRLNVYYDPVDRPRLDAWKDLANDEHGLSDPNDPDKQRALCTPGNLPRDKAKAQEQLTQSLLGMVEQGQINSRDDVVSTLENAGFNVTRQTKSSISIEDPEGKPMRLKGALYERAFTAGSQLPEAAAERSRAYTAGRDGRLEEARGRLAEGIRRKRGTNQERYQRPAHDDTQGVQLDSDRRAGLDDRRGADIGRDGVVRQSPSPSDQRPEGQHQPVRRSGREGEAEPLREPERPLVREDRPHSDLRDKRDVGGGQIRLHVELQPPKARTEAERRQLARLNRKRPQRGSQGDIKPMGKMDTISDIQTIGGMADDRNRKSALDFAAGLGNRARRAAEGVADAIKNLGERLQRRYFWRRNVEQAGQATERASRAAQSASRATDQAIEAVKAKRQEQQKQRAKRRPRGPSLGR